MITKDGIVLASDSKESSAITSNETVKKIFKLDDHAAVGIAGDGPLAMHFFDLISGDLNFRSGISSVAEQLRVLGKDKFNDFFAHQKPEDRPSLTILLAGYTRENKAETYRLNSKDNFVPRKSATGFDCIGIPFIAEYLLNRLYEREITTEHAAELVTFCIKETGSQDNRVGGPTQIVTFSNTKQYAELSREKISEIEKKGEQLRLLQKGNFYPEVMSSGSATSKDATKAV